MDHDNYLFHIHTYRCGHASNESDEEYILKSIELGYGSITFTDHAPFPGDPFTGRMKYEQLIEYLESLHSLKVKYEKHIAVNIGLEIEYLPEYLSCYKSLKENELIDVLLLGQHHCICPDGLYTFQRKGKDYENALLLADSIVEAINTGLFDVVAHPDRVFKDFSKWNNDFSLLSKRIIEAAKNKNVYLEKNFNLYSNGNMRSEFWNMLTPENRVVYGVDAHKTIDLVNYSNNKYKFQYFKGDICE